MSIRANARRGFTLLEIMIAVLIIALITTSLYRFVVSNLSAIRTTEEISAERRSIVALVKMLEAELHDLPTRQANVISGIPHKFNNLQSDELTWFCRAGNGLFTKAAEGEWFATLTIQPVERGSRELEIGIRRRPANARETDYQWIPLLRNVVALEFRYFHNGSGTWLERWTDQNARPALVRVRILRNADDPPYEAVIDVPSAHLQQ